MLLRAGTESLISIYPQRDVEETSLFTFYEEYDF